MKVKVSSIQTSYGRPGDLMMRGAIEEVDELQKKFPDLIVPLTKHLYKASKPAGLGFLHYQDGDEIPTDELMHIVNHATTYKILRLDYVLGRGCKFTLERDGSLWIGDKQNPIIVVSEAFAAAGILMQFAVPSLDDRDAQRALTDAIDAGVTILTEVATDG